MALVKGNARSASALDATILTGNLPAISGASLTGVTGKILSINTAQVTDSTTGNNTSFAEHDTDLRVSINPAMQLLDYLTNDIYGKGLDIETDIDLDSFKNAALLCDAPSNVTVIIKKTLSSTQNSVTQLKPVVGDIFSADFDSLFNSATVSSDIFKGTVAAVNDRQLNGEDYFEVNYYYY